METEFEIFGIDTKDGSTSLTLERLSIVEIGLYKVKLALPTNTTKGGLVSAEEGKSLPSLLFYKKKDVKAFLESELEREIADAQKAIDTINSFKEKFKELLAETAKEKKEEEKAEEKALDEKVVE